MAHNIGRMFYFGEDALARLGTEPAATGDAGRGDSAGALDWRGRARSRSRRTRGRVVPVPHRVAVVRDDLPAGRPRTPTRRRPSGIPVPAEPARRRDVRPAVRSRRAQVPHRRLSQARRGRVAARAPPATRSGSARTDVLEPYLLYSNSHDGSIAVDIRLTIIRVVCNNTLSAALRDEDDSTFHRRHRFRIDALAEDAHDFMDFALQSRRRDGGEFRHLAASPCDDDAFRRFLARLLPDPATPLAAASNRSVAQAHETRLARLAAARSAIALHP